MGARIRRGAAASLAVAAVCLLAACDQTTRVTAETYQDGVRCFSQSISADGQWALYTTLSDPSGTIVPSPQKTVRQQLGTSSGTVLATSPTSSNPGASISRDGKRAVFTTTAPDGTTTVKLWTLASGTTSISPAGEDEGQAAISADGSTVVYTDDAGATIWRYVVATGARTAVARPTGTSAGDAFLSPRLSSSGRYLVISRYAPRTLHVVDLSTGSSWALMASGEEGANDDGSISDDGRYVTYSKSVPGVLGGRSQVYLWDRTTRASTRLTSAVAPTFVGGGVISGDGSRIAYATYDGTARTGALRIRDRVSGTERTGLSANDGISGLAISRDGHRVLLCSDATNIAAGPAAPNLFLWTDV